MPISRKKAQLWGLIVLVAATFAVTLMAQSRTRQRPSARAPKIDYSQFSHQTHVTEQKLACESCHEFPTKNWKEARPEDEAFPDVAEFPEHDACLNCHRQQFFARERPAPAICSNCHVKATPNDTTRFLFPSLGDVTETALKSRDFAAEFAVDFPHDKHAEMVSCPDCHKLYQPQGNSSEEYVIKPPKDLGDAFWLKKGTFQTAPESHAGCFTCHNAEAGLPPDSKDCGSCHKLLATEQKLRLDFDPQLATDMGITDKKMLEPWSRRISAGAFRHEAGEHPDVTCTKCHIVAAMSGTTGAKRQKVPLRTCGGGDGCHITATSAGGGALNAEIDEKRTSANFVCVKCHVTFGRAPAPASHLAAIAPSKSN